MISRVREAIRWRAVKFYRHSFRPLLVKLKVLKHKPRLKQEAMFIESLEDTGLKVRIKDLEIDHKTPANFYDGKKYEILFPKRYVSLVLNMNQNKLFRFHFKGIKTPEREWVEQFKGENSLVEFTDVGRQIGKTFFDANYYAEMCQSEFVLCPEGKYKWTYRFYEAVLCRAIPVVNKASVEASKGGFKYYVVEDKPNYEYKEEWVRHNYELFLERHTIF